MPKNEAPPELPTLNKTKNFKGYSFKRYNNYKVHMQSFLILKVV